MLSDAHKYLLVKKYGLPKDKIEALAASGLLDTLLPPEVQAFLNRNDINSSGLLIKYPDNGAATIRLDTPPKDQGGRELKYLRRASEVNSLYVPPGLDLSVSELWITEGELKALCGACYGLPVVALSGIWNWRAPGDELLPEGEKLPDREALLPELQGIDWSGKKINLLYDSDISSEHPAYDAFQRLAEQLYRLGALEVRVLTLPSVSPDGKTGLDDFIIARGPKRALEDLELLKKRAEPYIPTRDGALAYAERLIKSSEPEDQLKATAAYLAHKKRFITQEWLREHGKRGDSLKALLQDAQDLLQRRELRPSAEPDKSNGSLGPAYDHIKKLLKPFLNEYDLSPQGGFAKIIWKESRGGGEPALERIPVELSNFVAWPTREILKDSGGSTERFIELEGLLQGAPLPRRSLPVVDFIERSSWAARLWGAKAAIRPGKESEVRYLLQLLARDAPESTIYVHLGWRQISGEWFYLHSGGAIGKGPEELSVEVELHDRLKPYLLPGRDEGQAQEAVKLSLSLLRLGPKKVLIPLYSLIWLAPLCDPLKRAGVEPGFVTYIWGSTGSFKSTIIALLLSHFGKFDPKGLPASFRDTAKSIEELAFLAKDTILVVDDLYPAKDQRERARLEGVLEYLSRNQGDRQGRGRLKATAELMTGHPPRGLALCSGEVMPLSGSSLARNLVIHLSREDINQERLTEAQAYQDLLPVAMQGYLKWLAPQMDGLPDDLKDFFLSLREEAQRASKVRARHRRYDEVVAYFFLGLHTFLSYALSTGAISQEEAKDLLKEAWSVLNEVADALISLADREDPVKRFFDALRELLVTGRAYLASMEGAIPEAAERTPGAVKVGWGPDNGVCYLLWRTACEQVIKFLRAQGEDMGLSQASLLDEIERRGLLVRAHKDRSIQKKIAGQKVRVVPILEKAFLQGDTMEEADSECA